MRMIRAFIWGGAIGAVLGLLFAPQRGDVTRAQLQDRLNQWQGQAQSRLGDLKGTASGAVESSRKVVNTVRDQVQSMSGSTKSNTTSPQLQDVTDNSWQARDSAPTPSI